MNIFDPDLRSNSMEIIVRSNAGDDYLNYLVEFIKAGGKRFFLRLSEAILPSDRDLPVTLTISTSPSNFYEGVEYQVNIYYFPDGIDRDVDEILADLESDSQADDFLTVYSAINSLPSPVTAHLIYRGIVFCTNNDKLYPYAPVTEEFTVIRKDEKQFQMRQ